MSTRSIKTLVSTTIDSETYDSNRISRLIDNLELYQEKVDILSGSFGNIPQLTEDVSAIALEVTDLSSNVAGLQFELYEVQADVSTAFIEINKLQGNIASINAQLAALPTDVTSIVTAVNSLEYDVSAIKINISGISANVAQSQSDIADLSYTISLLPTDIGSVITDISNLEGITHDLSAIVYPSSQQTAQNTIVLNDLSTNVYTLNANNVKLTGTQNIGGNKTFTGITTFSNTSPAVSATNASVMISGGLGVAANAYVQGGFNVSGNTLLNGHTYLYGNLFQTENNTTIQQVGTGTNNLKTTFITALTVTSINGITNDKLQAVNSSIVYDLVTQGGIVPNGMSEISSTLQTLLNSLYSAGYRHFYLPRGTYIVQNITLGAGSVFYGDGKDTVLILPNSYSIIFPQVQNAVFALSQPNITIKDLTVNGNRDNISFVSGVTQYQYEGIALDTGANYTTLENIYVINTYNDGLDMDSVTNCIIRNSWFSNCGGHGIHLNGEGPAGYNCVNNIIDNCIIENCGLIVIDGATFSGIHCNAQAGHNSVSNVTVINCAYGGITNSGTNNNWTNIVVRSNLTTGTGIFISSTAICTNIDTVIVQGGAIGIDCQGSRSVISSVQMVSIATTGIQVGAGGSGNTFTNISLTSVSGSPLLVYGNNTLMDDVFIDGMVGAVEIYGLNHMFSNFAMRAATKKWQIVTSRSSFSNFHWNDSDATVVDPYVLNFVAGSSYNSFANMNYSGNRAIHFESTTTCLNNRFMNGYIAAGFTSNVLATTNSTYILGVNTSSGVVNMSRGTIELGPNDNLKQSGTGIIDQSGSGVNLLKSSLIYGNVRVRTDEVGFQLTSIADIAGVNGRLLMKADASNNDYNTLVDARDTVIVGTKGTLNTGVLTLTTESDQGDLGVRITGNTVFVRAPNTIELSGNVVINGIPYKSVGTVDEDLSAILVDISFIRADISYVKLDLSNVIADLSKVKLDLSAVTIDVSGLKFADTQNVKITGNQDISGIKTFRNTINIQGASDATSTATGALVVSGGLGVGLNAYLGGNLSMAGGNILQSSGSIISQSGTGTNSLKAVQMAGQLGMAYNSIIDVSAIVGTNANIVIQPKNNVVIQGTNPITLFPNTVKNGSGINGVMMMNNAPYSAGMVIENTSEGNILTYGINMTQVGTRVNTIGGGIFRFDTRPSLPLFQVLTYKAGGAGEAISFQIDQNGNARVPGLSSSTSTSSGAFTVGGGVGVAGELYVGGISRITNTTESTSAATGAFAVSGGVGIGANAYVAGNMVVSKNTGSLSTASGALQVTGGAGIGENLYVGGIGSIGSTSGATTTATGALRITGGVGVGGNVYTGGISVITNTTASTTTNTGALQVAGGAGVGGDMYLGGVSYIQSTSGSTTTATGALRVSGGAGIGGNVYVGGIGVITNTTAATATNTGALQVAGGVGVGENLYVGGIESIVSTSGATNTATGALRVSGGVGVGGNTYVGGELIIQSTTTTVSSSTTGALRVGGGVGVGGNIVVDGIIRTKNNVHNKQVVLWDQSPNDDPSGATNFYGFGVNSSILRYQVDVPASIHRFYSGTNDGTVVAGNLLLKNNNAATNTTSGSLRVSGGVGIVGNAYIGGQTFVQNNSASLGSSTTGALLVDGGVGIGGNVFVNNMIRIKNNVHNKQFVLWDGSANEDPSGGTSFMGFGVNDYTLRYQTNSTADIHRFYSGTNAGTMVAGNLLLNNNNASTTTSTGSLRVAGGIGVGGNLNIGGSTNVSGNLSTDGIIKTSNLLQNKRIVLFDSSLNEPPTNATLFYGFGIQDSQLRYQTDASSSVHRFYSGDKDGILVGGNLTLLGGNTSLDASSGALVVAGGVGIGANLNVRGLTVIENNTQASTVSSGALVVNGGVGIGGDIVVGGNLLISGATSFTGADISGVTTFRNSNQSVDPSGGAVIVYGGVGVGKDLNVRGNVTLGFSDNSNVNLVLYGNTAIVQNGTSGIINTLKSTKFSGNLNLSSNNILDVSGIFSNGNITISSTNNVRFTGDNGVALYTYVPPNAPATTKNALYMNEPAKSGIATESNSGNAIVIGINTGHLGQRTNALQGAIAKFDSRVGEPMFAIETATGGAANTVQALKIDGSYNTTLYGNTAISNATEATSTSTGAFQVSGGAGIGANLYVAGNVVFTNTTNASSTSTGALRIAGGVSINGNAYMSGPVVISDTTGTTNTSAGALRVGGGLSVAGNVFAENMVRIANGNNNKKFVLNDLSVNEQVSTATQFTGLGMNSDGLRYQTESTSMVHKFYSGTSDGIMQAGNLTLTKNIGSLSTTTGTLIVSGGAGIAGNVYMGGRLYNTDGTESASTTTGSVVFSGGIGIGGNMNVAGNIVQSGNHFVQSGTSIVVQSGTGTNTLKAVEMIGQLDMSYNSIIDVSAIVGTNANIVIQPKNNVVIQGTQNIQLYPNTPFNASSDTKNGVMILNNAPYSAGMVLEQPLGGNVLSYGINTVEFGTRTTTIAGAMVRLDTRGGENPLFGVFTQKPSSSKVVSFQINEDGNARVNTTNSSTSTTTGAFTVGGGVGISGELYVGGISRMTNTTDSTSSTTGAFAVSGGVGVGANLVVGGNSSVSGRLTISNTTQSTSTATGAFTVSGGVGIGGNLYVRGNTVLSGGIDSTSTSTGTLIVSGGVGISQNTYLGGHLYQDSTNIYQTGLATLVQTGTGTNTMKAIDISSATASTSTSTGALIVRGGAGIAGNVSAMKLFVGEPTRKETEVDIQGNVCVGNKVSTYPVFDANYPRRTLNVVDANASLKIAAYNASATPVLEMENWNATTLQNTWKVEAGSDVRFQYMSGATLGSINEIFRIDPSFVRVTSTRESTGTTSAAFVVAGGAGIGGNLVVGGNLSISSGNLTLSSGNVIQTSGSVLSQTGTGTNTMKAINITDTTNSTTATTGALTVGGGAGIIGNVVLGNTLVVSSTLGVINSTTQGGAMRVLGGVGIAGNTYVGGLHRMANISDNKKIVVFDGDTTEAPTSATNFYGFGQNTDVLRYQAPTGATHKFYTGSSGGNMEAASVTLTSSTGSLSTTTGSIIVNGGAGIGGNAYVGGILNVVGNASFGVNASVGGNLLVGVGKQVVITTDTWDNSYNTLVDVNDSVVAGVDTTANTGVLTLTTFANQGDVGLRITNQNITAKAPDAFDMATLMRVQKMSENFTTTTIVSDTVTVNYSTSNSAYYIVPTGANNLTFDITNVPTGKTYSSYTLTFLLDTSTYKVYGSTIKVNGSTVAFKYGLGSAHSNINDVSLAIQQVVIFFTTLTTPNAVLTSVTGYI